MKKLLIVLALVMLASPSFASGGSKSGYMTRISDCASTPKDQVGNFRIESGKGYSYVRYGSAVEKGQPVLTDTGWTNSDTGWIVRTQAGADTAHFGYILRGIVGASCDSAEYGWIQVYGLVDSAPIGIKGWVTNQPLVYGMTSRALDDLKAWTSTAADTGVTVNADTHLINSGAFAVETRAVPQTDTQRFGQIFLRLAP